MIERPVKPYSDLKCADDVALLKSTEGNLQQQVNEAWKDLDYLAYH